MNLNTLAVLFPLSEYLSSWLLAGLGTVPMQVPGQLRTGRQKLNFAEMDGGSE